MRPWAKLWRRESARFKSLPLAARAIASYVLKFVDAEGALPLGKRDVVTAVALAVSAEPSERRWLKPAVEALLAHEYLVVREGLLVVGNFPRYQDESRRENDARPTSEQRSPDVGTTLVEHSPDVDPTLTRREISVSARKDTLAQNVLSSEREEIEKKRESKRESTRARLVKGFQKRWQDARKAMWPGTKQDPEWDAAAKFITTTAEMRGVSVESLATEALDSWFADEWVIANKYPDTNFPKHIAKHIDRATQPGARPTTGAEAAANAECASIRAELEALEGVPGSADRRGQLETALDAARDRLRIARGAQ